MTLDICPRCRGLFVGVGELYELLGAIRRNEFAGDSAVSHLSNLPLGLYIAARLLGEARGRERA